MKTNIQYLAIFILLINAAGCKKPSVPDNPVVTTGHLLKETDKKVMLYRGAETQPYAIIPGSLFGYGGGSTADTSFLYYNPDKSISRAVITATSSDFYYPEPMRKPIFLQYNGAGLLTKVYTKQFFYISHFVPNYNVNYELTLGVITPAIVESYDSLVYDSKGRVSEIWTAKSDNELPIPHFRPGSITQFTYLPSNDSLLAKATLTNWDANQGTGYHKSDSLYFGPYDMTARNPLYTAFKQAAFIPLWNLPFNTMPVLYPSSLGRYMSLNPYMLNGCMANRDSFSGTAFTSFTVTNKFDSTGLVIQTLTTGIFSGKAVSFSYY